MRKRYDESGMNCRVKSLRHLVVRTRGTGAVRGTGLCAHTFGFLRTFFFLKLGRNRSQLSLTNCGVLSQLALDHGAF
jgi:hypothetical protein